MNKQKGFSFIEIFVSLAVGLFLIGGVLAIFSSMRITAEQTSRHGQLQENGQLAMSFLTDDLMRQAFWGDMVGSLTHASLLSVPVEPANDCFGDGINNNTFPKSLGHFRALWGETSTTLNALNCIDNAKIGSDVIQFKRVISTFPTLVPANLDNDRYYLITNSSAGAIFDGDAAIPNIEHGDIWEYQHHIYYVREDIINNERVPILMRGRLDSDNNPFSFSPIVDGIELLRFTYGVDTDGDGVVNVFLDADEMTNAYWDNEADSRILAVTVYVLVRELYPDFQYENTNTYRLGDLDVNFLDGNGNGDNYHRLLLTSTITLHNAGIDSW